MDRILTPTRSKIILNKLSSVVEELQSSSSPNGTLKYQTQEQLSSEAHKLISRLYKDPVSPLFQNKYIIKKGYDPDIDWFNNSFSEIQMDLNTLFAELENLETIILGGFNYMVSRMNRLSGKLKQASSRLSDFSLYASSNNRRFTYFSDSFNNLERIESRSPLLKEEQVEINEEEGILTLPIDKTKQKQIQVNQTPVINSNSNGVPGNNYESNSVSYTDISKILDYNEDTWFEYERVIKVDDGIPLILDFTINMGDTKLINYIRINPNNFGARTLLEVIDISTSFNGKDYESIKDDLLATDLIRNNQLIIAPSSSKYAGQGIYSFSPRKAKYIRVSLKQTTPYIITTTSNKNMVRYAIGIRDIHIESRPYKNVGELISKTFSSSDNIRKISLATSQNPSEYSTLANVSHFISIDNGVVWNEIQPLSFSGKAGEQTEIREILDFNGVDPRTIKTDNPVKFIRYRVVMKRNTEAFNENAPEFRKEERIITEIHQVPQTTPFSITLNNPPIDGTVSVIDPFLGSRGIDNNSYVTRVGKGSEVIVNLPWDKLEKDLVKRYENGKYNLDYTVSANVYVDGVAWEQGNLSLATSTDRYYELDYGKAKIRFGDGTNGKAPPTGSLIEFSLTEERIFPSSDEYHSAYFQYSVAADNEEIEIYSYGKEEITTEVLKKGNKTHQLVNKYIDSGYQIKFSHSGINDIFSSKQEFRDGNVELRDVGSYSIDYDNGIVYLYGRTSESEDTTITYKHTPKKKLSSSQFSVSTDGQVSISKDAWYTITIDDPETVPTSVNYFNLGNLSIVEGSVRFFSDTTSFLKEVPFVDGRTELQNTNKTVQKITQTASVAGTVDIDLDLQISSDTNLEVGFTNTDIFRTEVSSLSDANSTGKYYIYRGSNPYIRIYVSQAVTDFGEVSYYYTDPNASLSGRYSINYKTGEVYTYTQTSSGVTVSYSYTDYRAKYPIARKVNNSDFTVNVQKKTVTFADREISKRINVQRGDSDKKYYRISYKYISNPRDDILELEPYYTPVLMDYRIKVITESRMV